MAHDLNDIAKLMSVLIAFVSFSICASGVYLLNDLFDLEADRAPSEEKTTTPSIRQPPGLSRSDCRTLASWLGS